MKKYKFLLFYMIPILLHLLLTPFWFLEDEHIVFDVALWEMLISAIFSSVYLVVLSIKTKMDNIKRVVMEWICMVVILIAGAIIHYLNWGVSTGYLQNPDSETVMILNTEIAMSIALLTIGMIIVYGIKRLLRKRMK